MQKFTIEHVKKYCSEIGLQCISDKYVDIKKDLMFICPKCGDVYNRNFDNIKNRPNGINCYKCSRFCNKPRASTYSIEYVKTFIEVDSDSKCILISDNYKNSDTKITIQCQCGELFKTTFSRFKNENKRQCNKCGFKITSIKNSIKPENIIKYVENFNYKYIKNDLSGGDQKILIQCEKKHEPYWTIFSKFKIGRRCPHCKRSLGEEFIRLELERYNVAYKQEYSFKELVGIGGKCLRYDFAIFQNNKIVYLIEYDGLQHFEVCFNDSFGFERNKIHDKLKNDYAKRNNIPLDRIKYNQYSYIPDIITKINNKINISV